MRIVFVAVVAIEGQIAVRIILRAGAADARVLVEAVGNVIRCDAVNDGGDAVPCRIIGVLEVLVCNSDVAGDEDRMRQLTNVVVIVGPVPIECVHARAPSAPVVRVVEA